MGPGRPALGQVGGWPRLAAPAAARADPESGPQAGAMPSGSVPVRVTVPGRVGAEAVAASW